MSTVTVSGVRAPPLAEARLALVGDLLAGAPARVARRGRHHGAEDRAPHACTWPLPRHVRHATGAVPGAAPLPAARLADGEPVDLEIAPHAERRLAERQRDAHAQVLAVLSA